MSLSNNKLLADAARSRLVKAPHKIARTAIYELVFGRAKTAKDRGKEPEHQGRERPVYPSYREFKEAARSVIDMFDAAALSERREKEIIAWLNRLRPKGAKAVRYVRDTAEIEEIEGSAEDLSNPINVRGETRRALEAWS